MTSLGHPIADLLRQTLVDVDDLLTAKKVDEAKRLVAQRLEAIELAASMLPTPRQSNMGRASKYSLEQMKGMLKEREQEGMTVDKLAKKYEVTTLTMYDYLKRAKRALGRIT